MYVFFRQWFTGYRCQSIMAAFLNVGSLKGVDERIRGKTAEVGMQRNDRHRKELKTQKERQRLKQNYRQ